MYTSHKKASRPTYTYHYFNIRGRGETARLICAARDIDYKDNRVEFAQWPDLKTKVPFGRLPILEINGDVQVHQSAAICRYLARECGLAGETPFDGLVIDSLADTITELREEVVPMYFIKDEEEKKAKIEAFKETAKGVFENIEKVVKRNKGGDGFCVGNKMSWVDLHLYAVCDLIKLVIGSDALEGVHPTLAALRDRVSQQARVAEYLEAQPKSDI